MKKIILSVVIAMSGYCCYAQNIFPSNGNAGVGTTSPVYVFHINGSSSINKAELAITNSDAGGNTWRIGDAIGASAGKFTIYNVNNGGLPFTIVGSTGNVGIGTTTPTFKLDVSGNFKTSSAGHTTFLATGAGSGDGLVEMNNASDIETIQLYTNGVSYLNGGDVGIGTTDPHGYKLAVNGSAIATSMTVKLYANWPDYVFKKDYKLPSLSDVKSFIDKNNHLPDMPSEQEVKDNGINLGEMVKLQTKKIEELTLYLIDKDKRLTDQQEQINELKEQLNEIKKSLSKN